MDFEDIRLSEISVTKGKILSDSTCVRYLGSSKSETENRIMLDMGGRERHLRSYCFMNTEVQFYKMNRALKMLGGEDHKL